MGRLAPTLLALALIGATSVAFVVTERLKLERTPITAPRFTRDFSPVCDCPTARARLALTFRRPDTIDAEIVDAAGEHVRQLARNRQVASGVEVFVWDGRDDAGAIAPDGRYRLRLHFDRERRTILVPTDVRLDTRPPVIRVLRYRPEVISPNGDGRADRFRVVYRASERGHGRLEVDGTVVIRSSRQAGRHPHRLQWLGTFPASASEGEAVSRVPAPPGDYEVVLVFTDLAGNEARAAFPLRVRYVELDSSSYAVPAGGTLTFAVDTDVETFAWALARSADGSTGRTVASDDGATARTVSVRLPRGAGPGDYVLRVAALGHGDRASVTVTERSG